MIGCGGGELNLRASLPILASDVSCKVQLELVRATPKTLLLNKCVEVDFKKGKSGLAYCF